MRPAALGGRPYMVWKQGLVTSALARAGIEAPIEPLRLSRGEPPPRHLHRLQMPAKIVLGYNAARSHDVIDLEECPVLLPRIAQALPHVRDALRAAMPAKSEAKISVTAAANGLDCTIEGPALRVSAHAKVIGALRSGRFHPCDLEWRSRAACGGAASPLSAARA